MKSWVKGRPAAAVLLATAFLMTALATAGPAMATPVTDPSATDEGFSFQTLIFILLGVLALIIVCSLGPLSRMAERREGLRMEQAAKTRAEKAEAAGKAELELDTEAKTDTGAKIDTEATTDPQL